MTRPQARAFSFSAEASPLRLRRQFVFAVRCGEYFFVGALGPEDFTVLVVAPSSLLRLAYADDLIRTFLPDREFAAIATTAVAPARRDSGSGKAADTAFAAVSLVCPDMITGTGSPIENRFRTIVARASQRKLN